MLSSLHLYEFILCGGRNCSHQGTIAFMLQPHPHMVHLCLFTHPRCKYQVIGQSGRRRPTPEITCLTSDVRLAEEAAPKCQNVLQVKNSAFTTLEGSVSFRYDVEKLNCLLQTEISQQLFDGRL